MDFTAIYHFLFETFEGIGCLIAAGFVISIIFAIVSERRTRKAFKDRGEVKEEWEFEDENESDTEQN